MKTTIRIAAVLLSGAVFIGCDKKDTTTTVSPSGTTTTTTVTTPVAPTGDASKTDKIIDQGANALKSGADKLMDKAPTTAPAIPPMPPMPK
jgi:hypothetical protein